MTELSDLRPKVMSYYHKRILKFYSGINTTFDLAHMNFDDMNDPKLVLHDDNPVFIGHIEVDKEGISNFIHNTPLLVGCDNNCESISMQDFIVQGRLPSLSTIRQKDNDNPEKQYYACQTIDGIKEEHVEIFPLLRAGSNETSYSLRLYLNKLISKEVRQIDFYKEENADVFEWIMQNEDRFGEVCNRLEIAIFKTPTEIMLTRYANTDEINM